MSTVADVSPIHAGRQSSVAQPASIIITSLGKLCGVPATLSQPSRARVNCRHKSIVTTVSEFKSIPSARNAGWFVRWQYFHARDGWRSNSLAESREIEKAFVEKKDKAVLQSGGKLGRTYTIDFLKASPGFQDPHDGVQVSATSGNERPVRRIWYDPSLVDEQSAEGWILYYASISPNTVVDFFNMAQSGAVTYNVARKILSEFTEQAERSSVIENCSSSAVEVEMIKYDQTLHASLRHFSDDPIVSWDWYHGRQGNCGWKCYRGVESALIDQQYTSKASYCLLNGGKPIWDLPARPLKVQGRQCCCFTCWHKKEMHMTSFLQIIFGDSWTANGTAFAFHSQLDLCSSNRRGVRRTVRYPESKDYIYYMWLREFSRAPAMRVYEIYAEFLKNVAFMTVPNRTEGIQNAEKEARLKLEKLQSNATWSAPPQEDVPPELTCPITQCLLNKPLRLRRNPKAGSIESSALHEWLSHSNSHPLTREVVSETDFEPDTDLQQKVVGWMTSFITHGLSASKIRLPVAHAKIKSDGCH